MKTMNLWTGVKLIGVGAVIIAAVAGCGKKEDETAPATPPAPAPGTAGAPGVPPGNLAPKPGAPAVPPPGAPGAPKPGTVKP